MNVITKTSEAKSMITGRLSDGSDRQEIIVTTYTVKVKEQDRFYMLSFGHDPSAEEVETAFNAGEAVEVTTVEDLSERLAETRSRLAATEDALLALLDIL